MGDRLFNIPDEMMTFGLPHQGEEQRRRKLFHEQRWKGIENNCRSFPSEDGSRGQLSVRLVRPMLSTINRNFINICAVSPHINETCAAEHRNPAAAVYRDSAAK